MAAVADKYLLYREPFFFIRGHDQAIEADDVVGSCGFSLLVLHAMARYTIIQNHLQTCLNNIYIVRQQPWSWTH
jgi:hypothetical protein